MNPRALLITTDAVGGVWQYSCTLARQCERLGTRCAIAVLGPSPSPSQLAESAGLELIETGLALEWTAPQPGALRDAARAIGKLARARGASLHLHSPALAQRDLGVPAVAVAHSCVGTWWRALREGPYPEDLSWRVQAMAEGVARADAVIAPSAAFAASLRRAYGADLRLQVIHNGIDTVSSEPVKREAFIMAAGRVWDEAKGMATLAAAAARLSVPVRVAGPLAGPPGGTFVPFGFEAVGSLDGRAMREMQARAALFAAPSVYEPFGLAVLEAAATGAPLVLSDIPSFRELWDGAAVFVAPGDVAAWARALDRLMADAPARRALGDRARGRARRYPAAVMTRKTLRMHAEMGALVA